MLKNKARTAVLWSGGDIVFRQGLQFGIAVALARILSPEDFGIIALLYLFTGIASAFVDSGFSSALIQRQDTTHLDESTVFWINLAMAILSACALLAIASSVANFYSLPILEPLTGLMALNVIFSSLGAIHNTLLTKRLDFKTQMKIGVVSSTSSGLCALMMASDGYGVWALAFQAIIATAISTLLLWIYSPWRPMFAFSTDSARKLFGFGGYLMVSTILETIYARIYALIIGKLYSVRDVGIYNRADGTMRLPVEILTSIFSRVLFPIFAAAATDKERLARGLKISVRILMLVTIPMMLGLISLAEPLVLMLLGLKWISITPILQILCLSGMFLPLHVLNLRVLLAQGHSRLFFKLEIVKKLIGISLLLIGSMISVIAIAWSQVAFGFLAFLINAYYSGKHLNYGAREQVLDTLPTLSAAIPMALLVNILSDGWGAPPWQKVVVLAILGAALFAGLATAIRLKAIHELISISKLSNK